MCHCARRTVSSGGRIARMLSPARSTGTRAGTGLQVSGGCRAPPIMPQPPCGSPVTLHLAAGEVVSTLLGGCEWVQGCEGPHEVGVAARWESPVHVSRSEGVRVLMGCGVMRCETLCHLEVNSLFPSNTSGTHVHPMHWGATPISQSPSLTSPPAHPQAPTSVPRAPCARSSSLCSLRRLRSASRSGLAPTATHPTTVAAAAASRCGSTPRRGTPMLPSPNITPMVMLPQSPRALSCCSCCPSPYWPCSEQEGLQAGAGSRWSGGSPGCLVPPHGVSPSCIHLLRGMWLMNKCSCPAWSWGVV